MPLDLGRGCADPSGLAKADFDCRASRRNTAALPQRSGLPIGAEHFILMFLKLVEFATANLEADEQ